jgi:hypothetical protein
LLILPHVLPQGLGKPSDISVVVLVDTAASMIAPSASSPALTWWYSEIAMWIGPAQSNGVTA